MTTEHDVMPYDATLLARVIDDSQVSVQAVANRSGYDDKSIYRYLTGERTVPSSVLRAAFELTRDVRLVQLVAGSVPVVLVSSGPAPIRIPPVETLFPQATEALESLARSLRYVHKIAADRRIDAGDDTAIENFKTHAAEAQRLIALTTAAMESHRAGAGDRR